MRTRSQLAVCHVFAEVAHNNRGGDVDKTTQPKCTTQTSGRDNVQTTGYHQVPSNRDRPPIRWSDLQLGNIPALVLPSGGMAVRHRKGVKAEQLTASRLRQPGSSPALVLPSSWQAARHRKGATAERFIYYLFTSVVMYIQAAYACDRGQPGSSPALVLPSGGMAARHRKGATAERFIYYLFTSVVMYIQAAYACDRGFVHQVVSVCGRGMNAFLDNCQKKSSVSRPGIAVRLKDSWRQLTSESFHGTLPTLIASGSLQPDI
ncbi:hypothetical protein T265_01051 [Opisthorchis viverrini]|uniref:Uncharacterized protein n=1 Tax=Opisthorchis viverrini TaxID=6198 RepID=A0A075AJ88_OPIVI|nr:hypothetical protein T265_01051 [Opisthorchis viverrini]KER32959.1 hypothetical protein T265_01051 [Opisthorchis viverrini]